LGPDGIDGHGSDRAWSELRRRETYTNGGFGGEQEGLGENTLGKI
jgi:hypothetical protein